MKKLMFYAILVLLLATCKGPDSSPDPAWVVSTFASDGTYGYIDGAGGQARFGNPRGVAVDSSGNVYVADSSNHRIRKITSAGVVSTIAGSDTRGGRGGHKNGAAAQAQFNQPHDVAVDSSGNVYVADYWRGHIRKIARNTATDGTVTWEVSTLASGFSNPSGVAVDSSGNVYVADSNNDFIKKLTKEEDTAADGTETWEVSTIAGSARDDENDKVVYRDGDGTQARFDSPRGVAVDSSGNIYVADTSNDRIRKIEKRTDSGTETWEVSTIAGDGTKAHRDGAGGQAQFNSPWAVALDSSGNVYVADSGNHRIRKITGNTATDGTETWAVSTIAGSTQGHRDGVGTQAQFNEPNGVAVDPSGNIYVGDSHNNRIRKIEYKAP